MAIPGPSCSREGGCILSPVLVVRKGFLTRHFPQLVCLVLRNCKAQPLGRDPPRVGKPLVPLQPISVVPRYPSLDPSGLDGANQPRSRGQSFRLTRRHSRPLVRLAPLLLRVLSSPVASVQKGFVNMIFSYPRKALSPGRAKVRLYTPSRGDPLYLSFGTNSCSRCKCSSTDCPPFHSPSGGNPK